VDTVEHAEMVNKENNGFVERRLRKRDVDPDEKNDLWRKSVSWYNAGRQEENRLAWCDYFELRAGGVGSCVLRFTEFPDFVTDL
jgi:hypothetical protein